ncbi:MAG: 16S rRNA (cytosine(1402)-N(4))-methyltransferase RsmH [Candidatus Levybacteria bacterium]|nr:16S rRNA (cytosine(1402)-N(4))-methyltransferase RsmH [Candidatus Levybacteria bacterium]
MSEYHVPVLLKEVIDYLNISPGKKYIDATLGGGGHTFEILKQRGKVLGVDFDEEAIAYVVEKLKTQKSKFKVGEDLVLVRGNFKDIDKIAHSYGFDKVNGILFDLGVSSHQIDEASRGFSFQKEAPLDMRMSKELKVKASDLVNILTKGELYELFTKLGEEYHALAISNDIIRARRVKPIETTGELARIVRNIYGRSGKIDPATRVFQALRIAVNDELNNLKEVLPKAVRLLKKDAVLLVIAFHSLEDRIVKNSFKDFQKERIGEILTKKPIIPALDEQIKNKRSRSSKLRVFKKT